ncbi:uncharacterized protein LOC128438361 [Xyrichtys novacula]|uniref:Ciliary neurotrophic factor n=1 Tax=Xyrichtys novacula TaxID=13765 RepID=A0AAV1G8E4_XYRNO|nr:uncharacterized protein LOC128438361 [Xyrichtys novacula]
MMDVKPNGFLSRYILALMLLEVQGNPVILGPLYPNCKNDVSNTKDLSKLSEKETTDLLEVYSKYHGSFSDSTPKDVPDPAVSGDNFPAKLLNIYSKDELFSLHILKVEEYQEELGGNYQDLKKNLSQVKVELPRLVLKLTEILKGLDPNTPLPPKPEPLKLNHDNDYDKQKYGWQVINTLKSWLSQVVQALEEGEKECDG